MSVRLKLHGVLILLISLILAIGTYSYYLHQINVQEERRSESSTVEAIEQANQIHALLHAQIESWKNILVSENETNNYHKYLSEFYRNERKIRNSIKRLNKLLIENKVSFATSDELVTAHHELGRQLRQALKLYNATTVNPMQVSAGFSAGIEKVSSELIQNIINQLITYHHEQQEKLNKLNNAKQIQLGIGVSISIVLIVGWLIWVIDSKLVIPAEKAIFLSDVIENAETVTKFGIWDWNIVRDEHFWSNNLYNVLGLSRCKEPSLESFISAIVPSEQNRIRKLFNNAVRTGQSFEFETQSNAISGDQSAIYVKGEVILTASNAVKRINCIVRDISEFRKIHDRFVKSDAMFRSVFNAAGDAILILKNGVLIDCNPQALVTFGCDREDLLGKSPVDFSPERQPSGGTSADLAKNILRNLQKNNSPQFFSWKHIRLDGSTFDAEVTLTNVILEGEACVQGIVRDVTLRNRTEDAIRNFAANASNHTGTEFYQRLVLSLSSLFDMQYVLIGIVDPSDPGKINTLAVSNNGIIVDNFSYDLPNTPCQKLIDKTTCVYSKNIQQLFPDDKMLQEMGVESYIGSPLLSAENKKIGLIVALDSKPIEQTEWFSEILQIYATRAAAEIDRANAAESLFLKERAMECATEGILLLEAKTPSPIVYANQAMESISGYSRNELTGKNLNLFFGDDTDPESTARLNNSLKSFQACQVEILTYRKDGKAFLNLINLTPVNNDSGIITHFICTQMDVTERHNTEEQLRRTQKMEAIGQLAGGIAHDFNNQLGIIIGYLDILIGSTEQSPSSKEWIDYITNATLRCSDLTRQLLTFSRTKTKATVLTELNTELSKLDSLITRSVTSQITVKLEYGHQLWPVAIDPGEFQDVLINLVINARDAMANGGQLVIKTSNDIIDKETALRLSIPPGQYVKLVVSDTGCGINGELLERIFEPFFTTKPEGKGTGLGLAMTYGFVKRSKGDIKVISQPGAGTTFLMYFPRASLDSSEKTTDSDVLVKIGGNEIILIVDDDPQLLSLVDTYLSRLGYTTYTANDSEIALDIMGTQSIDLLFTDMVMPGNMDGYALAERASKLYPNVKILFTSGFTAKALAVNDTTISSEEFLQKPYRTTELAYRIRAMFDN